MDAWQKLIIQPFEAHIYAPSISKLHIYHCCQIYDILHIYQGHPEITVLPPPGADGLRGREME